MTIVNSQWSFAISGNEIRAQSSSRLTVDALRRDVKPGCGPSSLFVKISHLAEPISYISPLDGGCSSAG